MRALIGSSRGRVLATSGHFTEGGRFQELWSQGRFVRGLTEFGFHIGYAAVWSGALVPYYVLRGLGRKEEK